MRLKKAIEILFILGLFFLPFNEYEGISILGEYKSEAAALFFILAFTLICFYSFYTNKIYLPYKNKTFIVLILFLIFCFISIVLNLYNIVGFRFKQTSGIVRFIRQYFSTILSTLVFFQVYWFVLKDKSIKEITLLIRKILSISFAFVCFYGFIETFISYFGFTFLKSFLNLFNYLPFIEVSYHVEGRISSISYEPPFLAIYLITIAGWMFSYVLTSTSKYKYIPTLLVLLLTFFSGSRTALIVVTLQFVIFLSYLYKYYGYKERILSLLKFSFVIFFSLGIFAGIKFHKAIEEKVESLDFLGNIKSNVSNRSRLGIQYTSLIVFTKNPIFGVGFGQQAFVARGLYPGWVKNDNYEFEIFYSNQREKSFPPGYNLYTRLLAEIGIVGFLIFASLQIIMIKEARRLSKFKNKDFQILGVILLITTIGLFINWMQIDTFRIYGVWISLAILIKTSSYKYE
jgi:O-antigen ligase